MLLHGALVAARRARDRGVGGGEHGRAAQAPAAVEAQEGAQGADRAGAEPELAAALLERAAGRARVRQGGGEAAVGGGAPARGGLAGAARRHAEAGARPAAGPGPAVLVVVVGSHAPVHARKACSCRRGMRDENHRSCLRDAPARPIETGS